MLILTKKGDIIYYIKIIASKKGKFMINGKMAEFGKQRSVIREIFEYGNMLKAEKGAENVFDFSLGNPSIEPPEAVTKTLLELIEKESPISLHGYTSAQGAPATRKAIADSINRRFSVGISADNVYMTCGAAASLTISLNALCNQGDEVIILAPYFPEYKVFIEKAGAKVVVVDTEPDTFQINAQRLKRALTEKTKAIIINSPNNPSGAVLTEESVKSVCEILSAAQKEHKNPIYILSDEPYRELSYGAKVPYIMNYYDNTLVCYSFSKSLSLPGERIGYIAVSPKATDVEEVYAAVCGAGRALGYVCAPGLFQKLIERCCDEVAEVEKYRRNRDLLLDSLKEYGYDLVEPDGAFYLFVRSPEPDAKAFCERAKKYNLLLVPSDSFGVEGYLRISYCVDYDKIERSLPLFKKLIEEYK